MCVVVQGLLGLRAGLWVLLGCRHAGLLPSGARVLHGSPVPCGKNLLKKFASKTKKKFWYEGPSLGPHLTYKPSQLEFLTKSTSKKTRKEDRVRLRALNGLLHKALTDLLCTPQVSQELCDLSVELSKVSVTSDFSACRVYWKASLSAKWDTHAEAVLQRSAAQLRHLLMSQQTLRTVPPIVFIQDKGHVALAEVDRLLAVADFGPSDGKDDVIQNSCRDPKALDTLHPTMSSSLSGIDHEALSRQIVEYKRRKDKGRGCVSPVWSRPEQVTKLTKQKQKQKKGKPCPDDDLSLRNCLWGAVSEDDLNNGREPCEGLMLGHEWELREPEQEPEVERAGDCDGPPGSGR